MKPYFETERGILYQGNALDILKDMESESVDCIMCSPPYWSLRDYGIEPVIWDEDGNCEHEWGISDNVIELERKKNYGDWDRPSRKEYSKVGAKFKCIVCGKEFKGKLNQKFCSTKCLNTLSNDERTNSISNHQYCLKCGAWKGSLGLEPTFQLYIQHLIQIFDEIKRVLKKTGTCWVNIGDTYASSPAGNKEIKYNGDGVYGRLMKRHTQGGVAEVTSKPKDYGDLQNKSLVGIPERFSIAMTDRGWIKRNTVIWHKPNCMPSSADDRFTVDHEYLYFFVKNNQTIYWTNNKTGKIVGTQPLGTKGKEHSDWDWFIDSEGEKKKKSNWTGHDYWFEQQFDRHIWASRDKRSQEPTEPKSGKIMTGQYAINKVRYGQQGRNKRCVWKIPTQPFPEAHFAVYPEKLCVTPIKAGCPEYICKKCGKAREKIYEEDKQYQSQNVGGKSQYGDLRTGKRYKDRYNVRRNMIDYTDCGCNASFEPGVVLDPFAGAGNTLLVAEKFKRKWIGCEISKDYCTMIAERMIRQTAQYELELT